MAGNPVLCTLRQVEKRYPGLTVPALGPLSLTLAQGEVLGIKGSNGAGKSTLLAILAGVLRPDAGQYVLAPQAVGKVAYVPQELSLYHTLTGLENLRFWGLACGLPPRAISTRSRWLLERLDLSEKGRQPVSSYSGGMRRRLHLATALMITPRVLLLDEPTVGADARSVELILSMVEHLRDMGCAIALISHQPGELERVCDRVLTLQAGRPIPEEGTPCPD
ncbi:ABC transporter ATP-binding protein [Pseudoflavonifractor phocaeensis]|uniref:ABC transporter ATP-binding protein n=1 Tax=Pseudoflavonifractor phocaeensis TaxID=1870988 RepID=UPI00195CE61E|nr:ABC transporter ATP-binding protein [Pseudoflavonifractor phocaeensis]MBM6925059.1 ABC transporter ATP-binding protein [Pseudoflavonifractor phocaeensis]